MLACIGWGMGLGTGLAGLGGVAISFLGYKAIRDYKFIIIGFKNIFVGLLRART